MARLPMVPENWLAGDEEGGARPLPLAPDREAEMKPRPAARDDEPASISEMLYRYSQPPRGTSLSLFMEPHEIASIPGLPDHVYQGLGDYADQRVRQSAEGGGLAGIAPSLRMPTSEPSSHGSAARSGYVSSLNGVSLAQPDWGSFGSDLSRPANATKAEAGDKLQRAATSVGILGRVTDGWGVLNHGVGLRLGMEGAERLAKYADPVGAALGPIERGIEAYDETSKGAPKFQTRAGAGAKSAAGLWGAGAGAAMGAAVGGPFMEFTIPAGAFLGGLAADRVTGKMSNQQAGGFIDRMFLDKQ